jgi:TetR/AcrR family transcriptional regulator, repressor of fatR-cypB operon
MEKRERVLRAALELIPRSGLHNTPMAAIAREAGVAKGTPYLYFESKEALINELYLGLIRERAGVAAVADEVAERSPRETLWEYWSRYSRWQLDNPDAVNLIQQCEASGILTEETAAERDRLEADGLAKYADAVRSGIFRDLPVQVFYALFAGPVLVLAQLQAKGEMEVTEETLRATFEGVARGVLAATQS